MAPKCLYGQVQEKAAIELSKAEVLRVIKLFEYARINTVQSDSIEHPESSASDLQIFLHQLKSLLDLVDQKLLIDPYGDTDNELVTLDTGEYVDPEISKCLQELPTIPNVMYSKFVKERMEDGTAPISDIIPKSNLYTFLRPPPVNR